ncbi:MAG: ATP-binding protein [Defluviitaleaceae bacterium]|nr:ATP-binding protein [Defluviitaleaceae bacterium]
MSREIKIPYGISNFVKIRTEGYVYVDKTHFIPDLEKLHTVIHLRPRRFGKSLFVSMLESYYDVNADHQFDDLFKGLAIYKQLTADKNNYYILRFNFSGIATKDADAVLDGFKTKVKDGIQGFIDHYHFDIELDLTTPAHMLVSLFRAVEQLKLKHAIYIFIDEYDHFTNAVLTHDGLEGFMDLVRRGGTVRAFYEVIKEKMESGLIGRFFATGVMSVSLDSMTSGFNIAKNITTRDDFSDMMGFRADEVKQLLKEVELTDIEQTEIYEILKLNYNGYQFSKHNEVKVFNSTLIMYYLEYYLPRKRPPESLVDPNLNQKGATIRNLVNLKNSSAHYEVVEEIVKHGQTIGMLSDFIDIDERYDKNDFITLMFNIGLLTIKEVKMKPVFKIPNKIIEFVFLDYLRDMLEKKQGYTIDVRNQEKALFELGEDGKIDEITQQVSDFLQHLSVRDHIGFDEKYIKVIYKTMLSLNEQYFIYDEFPARQGFSDLILLKTPMSYAQYEYMIELKHLKKDETTESKIEHALNEGIAQIHDYMQDKRLQGRPDLKRFVVVFSGFKVVRVAAV